MASRTRLAVGKTEVMLFIILGLGAALVCMYLNQKPKVIERTIVIQPDAPPPPAPIVVPAPVIAPPPPLKPVVIQATAPPPPPTPECVIIEAKLIAAHDVVTQAQADLEATKKQSIANFHQSDDYKSAMQDLMDKEAARKAAIAKLAADNESGSDTDHDTVAVRTAAQDLITAKSKVLALESSALATDPTVADKEAALKSASDNVVGLQHQLADYVAKAILNNATPGCSIDTISMDPKTWTIETKLTPSNETDAAAAADATFNQIGEIIKKCLIKSPFTWQTAKFTVYANSNGKHVPLFQTTYSRDLVDLADQTRLFNRHYDNQQLIGLAQSIWLSRSVNSIQGLSPQGRAIQRASNGSPLIQYTDSLQIGGYSRTDGSFCPATFIRQSHTEPLPVTPVQTNGAAMPYIPLYSNSTPYSKIDPFNEPPP